MPLWELYSPKNFAGFFRPERAQKFSVDLAAPKIAKQHLQEKYPDKLGLMEECTVTRRKRFLN